MLRYSNGGIPAAVAFNAVNSAQLGDTLTLDSYGSGYDSTAGTWQLQCKSFPSGWTAGDTLSVEFDDGHNKTGAAFFALSEGAIDDAGLTVLRGPTQSITIASRPPGRAITIDSTLYDSTQTFDWEIGSNHLVSVFSPQSDSAGTQYTFNSWSDSSGVLALLSFLDDSSGYTLRYQVPDSADTLYANFDTQHYLTVVSEHGEPDGEGWYAEGDTATFAVSSPDSVEVGARFVLNSWIGTGGGAYNGTDSAAAVIMNNPLTETAFWDEQFLICVEVDSAGGGVVVRAPTGDWHNNGTTVTLSAEPDTANGFIFSRWSGALTGADNPDSVTVDSALTVTAHFIREYSAQIATVPPGLSVRIDSVDYSAPCSIDWLAGSTHRLVAPSPQAGSTGVQYVFERWSNGGAQAQEVLAGVTLVYTAYYTTQYFLTTSVSPVEGGSISPSPPGAWYDDGSEAMLFARADSARGYLFAGWTGDVSGLDTALNVLMDTVKTAVAHFVLGDTLPPQLVSATVTSMTLISRTMIMMILVFIYHTPCPVILRTPTG